MFKTALRLGPKIKLVSHSRRRPYNQASEGQTRYSFAENRHRTAEPRASKSPNVDNSPKDLPVSTGPVFELALEPLIASKPTQLIPSTCQVRALRAIDWLYGEQWQAGLLELDETTEL